MLRTHPFWCGIVVSDSLLRILALCISHDAKFFLVIRCANFSLQVHCKIHVNSVPTIIGAACFAFSVLARNGTFGLNQLHALMENANLAPQSW